MTNYKRQIDLFDPSQFTDRRVVVVGCGNVGSHTALALARMGLSRFVLVDFDTVEQHNLSSQAYPVDSIGRLKVEVLRDELTRVNPGVQVEYHTAPYQDAGVTPDESDILLVAVDTMSTRYEMRDMLAGFAGLIIDGRMGGGQVEAHSGDLETWSKTLCEDADTDPCGGRYISYTSYAVAGLLASVTRLRLLARPVPSSMYMTLDGFQLLTK